MFQKTKVTPNAYDITLKKLIEARKNAKEALAARVSDIIIKKNVIDLYPEGADKNRAIEDFRYSQTSLLFYIANYDDIYSKLMNFEFSKCAYYTSDKIQFAKITSHSIIESAYREFMRRD